MPAPIKEQITNGGAVKRIKDAWFIILVLASLFGTIAGGAIAWDRANSQIEINRLKDEKQDLLIKTNASAIDVLTKQYIEDVSVIKTKLEIK